MYIRIILVNQTSGNAAKQGGSLCCMVEGLFSIKLESRYLSQHYEVVEPPTSCL